MNERRPLFIHNMLGPPAVRASNRAGVLEAIRLNPGISRAELTSITGLTQAATGTDPLSPFKG